MIRRISAMLLAVASLFGVGVVTAAPTQAASCTPDNACLYSDADFGGYKRDDYSSRHNWEIIYYPGTPDIPLYRGDGYLFNVSSIDNWDTDTRISVYYNSQHFGPCFKIAAYGYVSNMAYINLSNGKTANDVMNSHLFGNNCSGTVYNF
ncbi:hypothetical protein ACFV9D_08705 [Streptomyces sp. NPDC059875]|uniref:hypothetical protein n=1 Tax=unclassified Streptomyces TaxID=2593676 RepID=UPI00364A3436